MSNKNVAYYPGCSGTGTSVEYDISTRAALKRLGVETLEVDDWSCCGSTPAHTVNHVLSAALSGRNLARVGEMGRDLVTTPCPSCLANLKTAAKAVADEAFRNKVNALLDEECPTDVRAVSTLQYILEEIGPEEIEKAVVRPLTGLRLVCYYGCLTTRPPKLMCFDDPEDPMSMDSILQACGAEIIPFPLKTVCCGAAAGMPRNDISSRLSGNILEMVRELDADAVAVACPLCQMNLDLRQGQVNRARKTKFKTPVIYFTQLMGLAMGLSMKDVAMSKLAVNPKPCLARAGIR